MWKTASASPPSGGRPRLVADHTHKEPCTKIARAGACLFLFTHLTVERCPFLFIYLSALAKNACAESASLGGKMRVTPRGQTAIGVLLKSTV